MRRAICWVGTMAVVLTGLLAQPAMAHQDPPGCKDNSLNLNVGRNLDTFRNGDVVVFTVTGNNTAGTPCNVTGANISLTLPAADGTETGQTVTLATNANVAAGAANQQFNPVSYTVALNPGVTIARVRLRAGGVVHTQAAADDTVNIDKTLTIGEFQPAISITKTASTPGGLAPQTVTYTYSVKNISTTPEQITALNVTDNLCAPITYISGDSNGNGLLEIGETFTYTCVATYTAAGTYVNTANVCGKNANPADTRDICAGPVTATVTVTTPPVPVRSASKPDVCISVPKKLSVRARELTTVKVQVTDGVIKNASIKLTGPGIKRSGRTNSKGEATFKVRPTKKGTLTISSSSCLNAARVSVKAARQTQSRQVPKNTG
jgi:uncharacterized repeat protein (TIGR01451 family)